MDRGVRLERGGVMDEALRCYVEAEAHASGPAELSEAVRHQADVLRVRCAWDAALERASQAEAIARDAQLPEQMAEAVNARAAIEQSRGHLPEASTLYATVLEISTDPRVRGCALQNLGTMSALNGDHDESTRCFEASLACFSQAGYDRGVAIAMNNVGRASLDRGDHERAEEVLLPAVTLARQTEDLELASVALVNLAEAIAARGELERAEEEASAALGFFKVSGNLWRQVECFKILGDVRRARGEPDVARRLYEQGLVIADQIGEAREARAIEHRLTELQAPEAPPLEM
ncbi:MAG TPA: tetratricopeptide repeat protein [Longimicrobiales bacterium]|nr:tetratricopeptide repeat protein [Longimicrobiales bacterium]